MLCGIGALVPTGGVLLAVAAVPLAVGFGSAVSRAGRLLLTASVIVLNAPWWLPALRSPVATVSDPVGLVVFGARDGPGGYCSASWAGGVELLGDLGLAHNLVRDIRRDRDRDARCDRVETGATEGSTEVVWLTVLGFRDWCGRGCPVGRWAGLGAEPRGLSAGWRTSARRSEMDGVLGSACRCVHRTVWRALPVVHSDRLRCSWPGAGHRATGVPA